MGDAPALIRESTMYMNVLDKNMNGIGSCMPENPIRSDFNIPHEQSSKAKGGAQSNLGLAKQGSTGAKRSCANKHHMLPASEDLWYFGTTTPRLVIRGAISGTEKIT